MTDAVIAEVPPSDGREWDCQCARCGSSCSWDDCGDCGGEGYHNDATDDCGGFEPVRCSTCRGRGCLDFCCSGEEHCEAHPLDGREQVKRGEIEWFVVRELADAP